LIYRERAPSPALADCVERLWWLEGPAAEIAADPIPPDGHAEIVVHGGSPFRETRPSGETLRQERALLAGQATRPVRVAPDGLARVAGARLRPDAAHALFGVPQWELRDRVVDLRDLDPRLAGALRGDVADRESGEEMLDGLAAALGEAARRRRGSRRDLAAASERPAARAASLALRTGGLVRVEALARTMGVTVRHAERLFRERVGLSPKQFLRIVRFQRALAALRAPVRPRWAEVALSLGFYDQAHFIRDFRELAGEAPGAWSAAEESLAAVFSAVRRGASGPTSEDVAFFQDAGAARA
jgi:AraC-like DNA-binding protein